MSACRWPIPFDGSGQVRYADHLVTYATRGDFPDTIQDQLAWMEAAGFGEVDVFHRYVERAVFDRLKLPKVPSRSIPQWDDLVSAAKQDIEKLISTTNDFLLIDDSQTIGYGNPHALPFLERDGYYGGPPADDAIAMAELKRMRQTGASFILFTWTSFWWIDYFSQFYHYLLSDFDQIHKSELLIAFDLR